MEFFQLLEKEDRRMVRWGRATDVCRTVVMMKVVQCRSVGRLLQQKDASPQMDFSWLPGILTVLLEPRLALHSTRHWEPSPINRANVAY